MGVPVTSRFQVTNAPTQAPGNCFICKSDKGPFIDTGLRHDFWMDAPDPTHDGNVYLCAACIREMAENFNLASVDVENKVAEARRAGVVEGVLLGKKRLDEFAIGFIDSSLGLSGIPDSGSVLPLDDYVEDAGTAEQVAASPVEGSQ